MLPNIVYFISPPTDIPDTLGSSMKIIGAIDKLVGASVAQTQASVVSAARTGFSTEALNKWQAALGVMKVDFGAFTASATNLNTAYNALKLGDARGFNAIATPLALLAAATGRPDVNPMALMNKDNETRIKMILDALLSMGNKETARTLAEQIFGDVGANLFAAATDRKLTTSAGILAQGGVAVPGVTAEQLKAADEVARAKQSLDTYLKMLGTGITEGMQPYLAIINTMMGSGESLGGTENIGRLLGHILGILMVPIAAIAKCLEEIAAFFRKDTRSKTDPNPQGAKGAPIPSTSDPQAWLDYWSYNQGGTLSDLQTGVTINVQVTGTGDPKKDGETIGTTAGKAFVETTGTGKPVTTSKPATKSPLP